METVSIRVVVLTVLCHQLATCTVIANKKNNLQVSTSVTETIPVENKIIIPAIAKKAGGRMKQVSTTSTTTKPNLLEDEDEYAFSSSEEASDEFELECPKRTYWHQIGLQCVPTLCPRWKRYRNNWTGLCMEHPLGYVQPRSFNYNYSPRQYVVRSSLPSRYVQL